MLKNSSSRRQNWPIMLKNGTNPRQTRPTEHFVCDKCNLQFDKKNEIIRHLKSICCKDYYLKSKKTGSTRTRRKNKSQDYEEILVDDGQKLNCDIRRKYKEISKCSVCGTSFSSKKNLSKHMIAIHQVLDPNIPLEERKPKIGHRCSLCEKVFSLRKNLYQHYRKVHGKTNVGRKASPPSETIKLICDACGVGFSEKKSLMRHLRTKHLVKLDREKKTVAVCEHCSSTFAHKKSLYKHKRKFHGAGYIKFFKEYSTPRDDSFIKYRPKSKNPGNVEDYACLKEILPEQYDYKLTQFCWLQREQDNKFSSNWFKAKLNFTCQNKEDVKKWTEVYEMRNKLCLRVLSFPRPRTPGVLYKGRFRCHHNTMPKKGAKPNAKHTACSAVLSITLLETSAVKQDCENSPAPSLKALIFMKNTHNHPVGDPASLRYRKPITQVKEKFLKYFEENKTVPQALAAHKADLQAEYDAEKFSNVVKDRAFMPDARWAYGLYYSYYKKKNCDPTKDSVEISSSQPSSTTNPVSVTSQSALKTETSPRKNLMDKLNNVFQQILQRCESSPAHFQFSVQNFISSYENNCGTDAQLSNALHSFARPETTTVQPFKNKVPYVKTIVNAPELANFNVVDDSVLASSSSSISSASVVSPIFKYATFSTTCTRAIRQPQTIPSVARTGVLMHERDIILPQSNTYMMQSAAATNTADLFETRPLYAIETTDKYDDCILYPIENRQNITNCWTMSSDYAMF